MGYKICLDYIKNAIKTKVTLDPKLYSNLLVIKQCLYHMYTHYSLFTYQYK